MLTVRMAMSLATYPVMASTTTAGAERPVRNGRCGTAGRHRRGQRRQARGRQALAQRKHARQLAPHHQPQRNRHAQAERPGSPRRQRFLGITTTPRQGNMGLPATVTPDYWPERDDSGCWPVPGLDSGVATYRIARIIQLNLPDSIMANKWNDQLSSPGRCRHRTPRTAKFRGVRDNSVPVTCQPLWWAFVQSPGYDMTKPCSGAVWPLSGDRSRCKHSRHRQLTSPGLFACQGRVKPPDESTKVLGK